MKKRKRTPYAVKFVHYKKARFVGTDSSTFEPLRKYRGDFYVFPNAVLLRNGGKYYQSGRGNWSEFE